MNGNEFTEVILQEVAALQTERTATLSRLQWLDRRLAAWNVILEEKTDPVTLPVAAKLEGGERANTMERVKELIQISGTIGILPREVREELQKAGITANPQVVSNCLTRWKRRDYTIEIEGRHYWKGYLSDIEMQKAKPRKRRGVAQQAWEPPTASP